jgi:hypothetical protein
MILWYIDNYVVYATCILVMSLIAASITTVQ